MKIKKLLISTILLIIIIFSANIAKAQDGNKTIDKIVAIVGDNEILYSDVENQYMQYLMQKQTSYGDNARCKIFEEILFAKLLLNQAQVDSVVVSDEMVESEMDRRLQYFISQIGSQEKLEQYYNKSIFDIKNDLRKTIHDQMLSEQVKSKITEDVKITPSEVISYFKSLPKDSIPRINSEYQYSEIVLTPKIQPEEKEYAKAKLEAIRERIIKGESFESLARVYSEDPGSAMKGGELGDFGRGVMYPEFEAAAFALQPNEISPVIETEAGYHILKLIKRKGDYINVRHILITTKVSPISLQLTKNKLDSIYQKIESGELTFKQASLMYSSDDSKFNEGIAINPATGNSVFSADQLDKDLFFQLDKMDIGQVSKPAMFTTEKNTQAFRIVKLDKRTNPHTANLEQDYDVIQEKAINQKKIDAVSTWIKDKTKKTYIVILDKDLKSCNFTYNWGS